MGATVPEMAERDPAVAVRLPGSSGLSPWFQCSRALLLSIGGQVIGLLIEFASLTLPPFQKVAIHNPGGLCLTGTLVNADESVMNS